MRVFILAICLVACGRSHESVGAEGAPCFPNSTCDAGLVCVSRVCVVPDLCADVACSGFGTCRLRAGVPACNCDPGFYADGLECRPGCPDGVCDGCPADMIYLAAQNACVDRYEASLFLYADCTGAKFGAAGWDDYPAGFPDLVESHDCTGECESHVVSAPTTEVYACSVADSTPSAWMTWYQAKRACENAGKHLCSELQWRSACQGEDGWAYPYGISFDPSACNGGDRGEVLQPTGSLAACEGGYPGLFDLAGNLWEWTAHGDDTDYKYRGGGGYHSWTSDELSCEMFWEMRKLPPSEMDDTGVRCCLAL